MYLRCTHLPWAAPHHPSLTAIPPHNPNTPQVDDNNTISPTLSLKKGYLTYTWTHMLGDGAKLETTIDPFNVRVYVGHTCICVCVHHRMDGWMCMCIYRGETALDAPPPSPP